MHVYSFVPYFFYILTFFYGVFWFLHRLSYPPYLIVLGREVQGVNYQLLVVLPIDLPFRQQDFDLPQVTLLHIVLLLFSLPLRLLLSHENDRDDRDDHCILSLLYESFYFYAHFFEWFVLPFYVYLYIIYI
jgi:hypothetical protein